MDRREFLRVMSAAGAAGAVPGVGFSLSGCASGPPMHDDDPRRAIILGFDGVDPRLLERWMDEGKLPFLARLREELTYRRLGTTIPPESPVAWSTFATGVNPGKHRIYDFLRRDLATYFPDIAEVDKIPPSFLWGLVPTKRPEILFRRGGTTFWRTLADHGFRSTAIQVPVSFPPEDLPGGQLLAGLSVPDVRGTQGTFHYYATDLTQDEVEDTEMGGKLVRIELRDGRARTEILGPWDPVLRDRKRKLRRKMEAARNREEKNRFRDKLRALDREPTLITVPLEFEPDPATDHLTIRLQGQEARVAAGAWSDWFEVDFPVTPLADIHGICHFYVEQVRPQLRVYFGPVEWHPAKPVMDISSPGRLSRELAEEIGLYKTRGWAVDTAALQDERIDEATLWTDLNAVMDMREKILFHLLDAHPWHFFIDVFSCTDRVQHMYWRLTDPRSPRYDAALAERWGDAILRIYQRMDRIVERVYTGYANGDTLFAVMSDHGFHSFNRSVNINTWLVRNGFMFLRGMDEPDYHLEHLFGGGDFWPNVVWERTKAYAMGLGQIYLNLAGREAKGCVEEGAEYDRVVGEIIDGLLALRDVDGQRVILNAYRGREVYSGRYLDEAPDIQIGFNEGYRVSWQTCLGGVPAEVIEDNPRKWSGDHCSFDASISPGILFINRPLARDPHLLDLAPTVLAHFGVEPPADYDGASLL